MRIIAIAPIALFIIVPEARALITPLVDRAEQLIDANLQLFFTGLLMIIAASFLSWVMARFPGAGPADAYRVVRRYRV